MRVGPGPIHELREQSALTGCDHSVIHDDLELAMPTLLEFDREPNGILDQRSETRCLRRRSRSRVAVDDSDAHNDQSSSAFSMAELLEPLDVVDTKSGLQQVFSDSPPVRPAG